MARFVPVTRQRHAAKSWIRFRNLEFARTLNAIPVIDAEIALVALQMPLAFLRREGGHVLVAVLSLEPGRNVFLSPKGEWIGPHIPVCLRLHPFAFLKPPGATEPVLCIDEESGLLADLGVGEAFFDPSGHPTDAIRQVLHQGMLLEKHRFTTGKATSALSDAGALVPWEVRATVAGLERVDEAALLRLKGEDFLALRDANALPIAYAQMISQDHIRRIEQLSRRTPTSSAMLANLGSLESLDSLFESSSDSMVQFPPASKSQSK